MIVCGVAEVFGFGGEPCEHGKFLRGEGGQVQGLKPRHDGREVEY